MAATSNARRSAELFARCCFRSARPEWSAATGQAFLPVAMLVTERADGAPRSAPDPSGARRSPRGRTLTAWLTIERAYKAV
jgi:hypothetical protein